MCRLKEWCGRTYVHMDVGLCEMYSGSHQVRG